LDKLWNLLEVSVHASSETHKTQRGITMFGEFIIFGILAMLLLHSLAFLLEDNQRFVDVDYRAQLNRALRTGDTALAMQAIRALNR
jgi:hypothetical protein